MGQPGALLVVLVVASGGNHYFVSPCRVSLPVYSMVFRTYPLDPQSCSSRKLTDNTTTSSSWSRCTTTQTFIMHRFNFNTHLQQTSQSITKCLAKLWHFSEFCKFRETLNDMLQYCLVYGVEDAIRQLPLADTVPEVHDLEMVFPMEYFGICSSVSRTDQKVD